MIIHKVTPIAFYHILLQKSRDLFLLFIYRFALA